MFWTKKKNDDYLDFFIKIGLTNQGKLDIYIGWPSYLPDEEIVQKLTILINGVINGAFSDTIQRELRNFKNPLINLALDNLPGNNKYINPMDVL